MQWTNSCRVHCGNLFNTYSVNEALLRSMEDSSSTANQDQIQELNGTLSQMIEVLHTSGCNMKVIIVFVKIHFNLDNNLLHQICTGIFDAIPASFDGSNLINNFLWLLPELNCDNHRLFYRNFPKICYHMQMIKEDMLINPNPWDSKQAS